MTCVILLIVLMVWLVCGGTSLWLMRLDDHERGFNWLWQDWLACAVFAVVGGPLAIWWFLRIKNNSVF